MKRALAFAVCAMVMVGFGATQRVEAAVPIVNSVSPNTKVAGSGAFVMTVTGSNFTTGSVARWNGTAISTGYVSSTQLSATVGSSLVSSTGTASVTVYTSGRKGGTSNTVSFTITAPTVTAPPPAPAPAPAPSPLSITTTSLPGGTANASFSSTVAATGGTPAYGWALVNGGGALPPGLTLAATGTISGTPTQSGTFTFTTQANDSASQIAQKVLSLTVAADPNATTTPPPTTTGGTVLFQCDFEHDVAYEDLGFVNTKTDVVPVTTVPPGRSGKALQFHYRICGATDGTCGAASQDTNRWVAKIITPGLEHVFVRGYVYFKSPEPGIPTGPTVQVQRKLMWITDSLSAGNSVGTYYPTLTSWTDTTTGKIALSILYSGSACGITSLQDYNVALFDYDTWYSVEVEIQLNTPGASDGVMRIWINGNKAYEKTSANIRGICSTPLSFFSIGRQANRYSYNPVDEYRYWDDWVISTGYIGP